MDRSEVVEANQGELMLIELYPIPESLFKYGS